jgi:hypothetical protein
MLQDIVKVLDDLIPTKKTKTVLEEAEWEDDNADGTFGRELLMRCECPRSAGLDIAAKLKLLGCSLRKSTGIPPPVAFTWPEGNGSAILRFCTAASLGGIPCSES